MCTLLLHRKGSLEAIQPARVGLLVVALVVSLASAAQAALVKTRPGSAMDVEEPVSASAAIATDMPSTTASLSSPQAPAPAEDHGLSDIQIAFGNTPTSFIATSNSSAFVDIASAGIFTINPGPIGDWAAAMSISQFFWATTETGSTSGRPMEPVIAPFDNGLNYSAPTPVIIGKNPQAQDTGTFDLIANGLSPTFISRSRAPRRP